MGLNSVDFNGLKAISTTAKLKDEEIIRISGQSGLNSMIRSISDNQEQPEPFYILDLAVVLKLMEKWNQSLPNVTPFYAVKCNPEPALLLALAKLGASFDCASEAEIATVLALSVSPDKIVYANPIKQVSHIKYAVRTGVNLTVFDAKEEIDKMKKWHPESELLLRIKVPNDTTSWRSLGTKYGASTDEIIPLLKHARRLDMKVVGISFHVGSKATEADIYRRAISVARLAFDAAVQLEMPEMHILDIGGGFKVNQLFDEIVKTVNESIGEFFHDIPSLKVIAEPGRFFVETAFTMATNVIGKRVRGDQIQYWIDDGIYGSFNTSAFDSSSMIFKPLKNNEENDEEHLVITSSTIFGPTCDSLDIVVKECKLPEMNTGDLLVFYNMGAYTTTAATKFNGFQRFEIPTYLAYSQ
ncbi:ornithine decarboxylase-like [Euphorbia lathyris]|uniref:ornithine decarboxylase-like n=1 Tax=Euphorbia lathyris TaxID=212925 RepID=UPI0033132BED